MTIGIANVSSGWQQADEPCGARLSGCGGATSDGERQREAPTADFTTMGLCPPTVRSFNAD
jgi:hypothetical protein